MIPDNMSRPKSGHKCMLLYSYLSSYPSMIVNFSLSNWLFCCWKCWHSLFSKYQIPVKRCISTWVICSSSSGTGFWRCSSYWGSFGWTEASWAQPGICPSCHLPQSSWSHCTSKSLRIPHLRIWDGCYVLCIFDFHGVKLTFRKYTMWRKYMILYQASLVIDCSLRVTWRKPSWSWAKPFTSTQPMLPCGSHWPVTFSPWLPHHRPVARTIVWQLLPVPPLRLG